MEFLMWALKERICEEEEGGGGIQAAQPDRLHYLIIRLSNHENINQHFFNIVSTFKQAFQELLPHVSLLKFCFPVKSTQTMCGNKKYIVGNILK